MREFTFDFDQSREIGFRAVLDADGLPLLAIIGANGLAVVDAICPHAGSSLADGRLVKNRIRCSRHGYLFDLETGHCSRAAEEGFSPLRSYSFSHKGDKLTVKVP